MVEEGEGSPQTHFCDQPWILGTPDEHEKGEEMHPSTDLLRAQEGGILPAADPTQLTAVTQLKVKQKHDGWH